MDNADIVRWCENNKDGKPVGAISVYHRLKNELDELNLCTDSICNDIKECQKRQYTRCLFCVDDCPTLHTLNSYNSKRQRIMCDIALLAEDIIDYYESFEKNLR